MRSLERSCESVGHLARAHCDAMSTGAAGGRRSNAPSNSIDAESAQWKSSSMSTSGLVFARSSKSARTARCVR